ncbi:MAG: insulinase family protein, partial [Verrucomicrobiae bacterium]|nr:insulinase family protein [Verrucomicrobiae bacterium]
SAFSPGGYSLAPDSDFVPASSADQVIAGSGIGNLDAQDLRKKLAGIQASVRPSIGELYENLAGAASPDDLETFFQLIYMRFTEPRTDENAFSAMITQMRAYVINRLNDPSEVFSDAVEKALYQNSPRHQPFTAEVVDEMNLQESFDFYKDRYADADDFTFIFVGAFELPKIRPLVEKYLASLPSLPRKETWRDVGDEKLPGQHRVVVHKGVEPKSSVQIFFHGPAEWSYEDQYLMGALIDVLKIPMREALREDKGGVYGVGVSGSLDRYPESEFSTSIRFGCNPDNVDDLIDTAFAVIEKIKKDGPDPEDLAAVKEMHLRSNETTLRENSFWSFALNTYSKNGIDFDA